MIIVRLIRLLNRLMTMINGTAEIMIITDVNCNDDRIIRFLSRISLLLISEDVDTRLYEGFSALNDDLARSTTSADMNMLSREAYIAIRISALL